MKKILARKIWTAIVGITFAVAVFMGNSATGMAYTETTGMVSADAAKVRKEPNTGSDVVVGLLKGSTVTVVDEVTDSTGAVWYKIAVDGQNGYVRSDLMIKATSNGGTVQNTTTEPKKEETKKPEATTATPIAETKAYVNNNSARIRQGASTDHEVVGSVPKNSAVTLTGEAKASDGKKWYQIKYTTAGGSEAVGFVRSDLVTVGDSPAAEAPKETKPKEETADTNTEEADGEGSVDGETPEGDGSDVPAEVPAEPEQPVEPVEETKPDYEMVYADNEEGQSEWYLYDNINGTRQKLAGLFAAAEAGAAGNEADAKQLSTQKIIIIVLAVLVAILAIVVAILLFKLKDLYDEVYEDEDDDEEDEDDDDEEEEEEPVRKKRSNQKEKQPVKEVRENPSKSSGKTRKINYDEPEEEQRGSRKPEPSQPQPRKKAKNFMIDDDEFEFEFLNMEDKD